MKRLRRLIGGALTVTALSVGASGVAFAQASRWERQVRDQLRRALATINVARSAQPESRWIEALNGEESKAFAVTLQGGVSYSIFGVCDNDCERLQLVLSTSTRELAVDRGSGSFPIVRFTPPETAAYRVKVVMDSCRMNPCWFAVAVVKTSPRAASSN